MTFSHTSDPLPVFIAYSAGLPTSVIRSAWPAVPPRSALYLEQPHSANSHSHSQPSRTPPCRAAAGLTALIFPSGSFNNAGSTGVGVGPYIPYTTPRARTSQCHPRGPFSFAGMASGSGECCGFWSCWSCSGWYGLQLQQLVRVVGCTTGQWAIGHSEQRRRPRAASGCTGRQAIGHSEQRRRPRAASSHLPHHIGASKKEPRPPRLTAPPSLVPSMPSLLALPLTGGGASLSATRCHPASGPALQALCLILSALCSLCSLCFQVIPFNSGPLFALKEREGFVPA